jgi:hypothetical protein
MEFFDQKKAYNIVYALVSETVNNKMKAGLVTTEQYTTYLFRMEKTKKPEHLIEIFERVRAI